MERVVKEWLQAGQTRPVGVAMALEWARPSKELEWWQERHRRVRRAALAKRVESGIWDSKGVISVFWEDWLEFALIWYFLVYKPRHSARRTESVPGIGAQRRSMGGKICFKR
jgi:hypothetical protein